MDDRTDVLLADPQRLFCEGLKALLEQRGAFEVSYVTSLPEAMDRASRDPPCDIALLDCHLPGMAGAEGLQRMIEGSGRLPVAVLAARVDRAFAVAAFECGAAGIVLKTGDSDTLLQALRLMLAGERYFPAGLMDGRDAPDAAGQPAKAAGLTGREADVLKLLVTGLSNKQIARELGIGPMTVAMHLTGIFRKYGVTSRTQAIAARLNRGPAADSPMR